MEFFFVTLQPQTTQKPSAVAYRHETEGHIEITK